MRQALILALLWGSLPGLLSAQIPTRLIVETIGILGADKTRHTVILNELTFVKGDTIHSKNLAQILERSRNNVYNLGLFNDVTIDHYLIKDRLQFIITVKERWYIYGSPYLQVEERNSYDLVNTLLQGDFHRLVYGASLEWRNLTGRNETLTFFGQLGFSQRLSLGFRRPSLRRNGLDHRIGIRYINQHEVIIGTEMATAQWRRVEQEPLQRSWEWYLSSRKRMGLYKALTAELHFQHYRFSDSLYAFSLEGGPPATLTSDTGLEYYPTLLLKYAEDRRDYQSFPLSGWKYQFMSSLSGGPITLATTSFAKLGATWAHHLPVGDRWNFAYGTQHLLTLGDSLPFFAKSFLGINRTEFVGVSTNLRGYEPYALASTYMGLVKTEWKYALIPRQIVQMEQIPLPKFQDLQLGLYLSTFFDAAYLRDDSFSGADQRFKNQLLYGYGVGINMIGLYDVLLRVEYSRNHLRQGGIYLHADLQIK